MTDEELRLIESLLPAEHRIVQKDTNDLALVEVVRSLLAEVERLRTALTGAFDAGFAVSGEGWNNEYPREFNTEQAKRYETERAASLLAIRNGT